MPELAEVEAYRRLAERQALGREIAAVSAPDAWYLKGGLTAADLPPALVGRRLVSADRQGKLLMLPTSASGPVLGLRFGMSGRLIVDGTAGMDDLWYSSNREETRWDRFALEFADGGRLVMRDPRRLGGVTLDPGLTRMGPDALTVTLAQLRQALASSRLPPPRPAAPAADGSGRVSRMSLKGRLMDQSRVAGVGNLAADEILWRAGLDPTRPATSLTDAELRRLHRHLRSTLRDFLERGGSHTGELMPQRHRGGLCPKDGTPLLRATVATRTTWWCPKHQH
ncbi:MAG: formamidopyrimidine-DNA glycosylase [Acidimicrobiaceae bacterium]|jgi:formamidopyrimidine-DNA glycosylase|nr:formamidopyrimidine-DNA glycosylase [Acidimicrobiaceae bacterium]